MHLDEIKKLQQKKKMKKYGDFVYKLVRGIIVCGVCYYVLFPILQSFFQTFMAQKDLYDSTVDLIPKNWTLDNLKIMFKAVNIPVSTLTTMGVCLLVTVTQLISCTLVGYGFARFKFPFKNALFMLVIFTLVVPPQTIVTPLYLNFRDFAGLGINLHPHPGQKRVSSSYFFLQSGQIIICVNVCGCDLWLFYQEKKLLAVKSPFCQR